MIGEKTRCVAPGLFFELVVRGGKAPEKCISGRKKRKKSEPLQRCSGIRTIDLLNRKPIEHTPVNVGAEAAGNLVNRTT
jgi:hypothetical protein